MARTGGDFITVVSGLPRSGTSMMMRMLAAGGMSLLVDNTRQPDIDNPNGYYELEAVKQLKRDASWLVDAGGKAVKIVYLLLYELPEDHKYRVIFMNRNLGEVVASQDAMLRHQHKESGALQGAALAEIFQNQLSKVQAWLSRRSDIAVLNVNYNRIITDPRSAATEIDEFLGGQLDTTAMVSVLDVSLYRQRQP